MSMTLIVWKAPFVDEPDEAARLLAPYHERGDASAFESSAAIATVSNTLRRRFPDAEHGPWADGLPPEEADRILRLSIRRSADATVTNQIVELARQHDLIVYDPQGPSFYLPYRRSAGPVQRERIGVGSYLKLVGMGIAAAGVFLLGWWIGVPVLNWILMFVGGFFLTVILVLLGAFIFQSLRR